MAYISVDVDIDDVYDEMSSYEKKQMAEWLEDDGYCFLDQENSDSEFTINDPNIPDLEWIDIMKKLFHGRLHLSNEDEEIIKKIANKL